MQVEYTKLWCPDIVNLVKVITFSKQNWQYCHYCQLVLFNSGRRNYLFFLFCNINRWTSQQTVIEDYNKTSRSAQVNLELNIYIQDLIFFGSEKYLCKTNCFIFMLEIALNFSVFNNYCKWQQNKVHIILVLTVNVVFKISLVSQWALSLT